MCTIPATKSEPSRTGFPKTKSEGLGVKNAGGRGQERFSCGEKQLIRDQNGSLKANNFRTKKVIEKNLRIKCV